MTKIKPNKSQIFYEKMTNFVILVMLMCIYMAQCSELERVDDESNSTIDEETSTSKKIGLDCYHCTAIAGEFGCEPPHERPNVTFQKNCGPLSSVDMRQACMIKLKVTLEGVITTIDRFCTERAEITPDVEEPRCVGSDGLWECRCFTGYCNLSPLDIPGYLEFLTPTTPSGNYTPEEYPTLPGRNDSAESTIVPKETTASSGFKLNYFKIHNLQLICLTVILRIFY